jgi:DNA polymerase III subunit beta
MKLNITKSNLQKALSAVGKAVSTKPTLEILKNIALDASKGGLLRVSGTDLELSISTYVGVDVLDPGSTTVNAKTFIEFISLLPDGNITLYLENNELKVEAEKVKSKFSTIPFEEFPTLPTVNEDATLLFKMARNSFKLAIDKTTFAADRGIRQPVFSGVLFENEDEKVNMVATDGFRLSKYVIELMEGSGKEIKPVVPYVSLDNLSRLSDDSEDDTVEAYMVSKNNQMLFKTGRTEITTSLLDGDFPNYRMILPEKTVSSYKMKLSELVDGVKLSNVFARQQDAQRIWFRKNLGTDHFLLQSLVPEIGEYESQVTTEVLFEEENLEISFNPRKLLDILSRISTEDVILDVVVKPRTDHRMLILKEEGNENFIHLLTPLVGA